MSLVKIFPNGVATILDFFLSNPDESFCRRDLHRKGLAPRTLDRHLPNLVAENILLFEQKKNRHYFSLINNPKTVALKNIQESLK